MVKGIGPVYAKRLVAAFGEAVFDVIEESPGRLREVGGIGPVRAGRIVRGWADQKVVREIMLFLHGHGVGTSRAVRIFKTYGADAVERITENPYRLARDIRGIGFKTADAVAARLGIEKTAMIRARAGVSFALAEAMDEGHCGLPADELRTLAAGLLEIPAEVVDEALALELAGGDVVADEVEGRACVFLAGLHRAERGIAERLLRLAQGPPPWPAVDVDKAVPWVEGRTGLALAASQREALGLALRSKVLVVTGGPGVGKTTLVNSILKVLVAKGAEVALAAPTGRAARRLARARAWAPARSTACSRPTRRTAASSARRSARWSATCWSWTRPAWSTCRSCTRCSRRCRGGPRCCWWATSTSCPRSARAGPGRRDRLGRGAGGQADGGVPAGGAEPDRHQRAPDQPRPDAGPDARPGGGLPLRRLRRPEDGVPKLLEVVARRIPARFGLDPVRDVQVLCPMNRGGLGARSLNLELQALLNPPREGEARVERFGWTYGAGDKVMQAVNDHQREVYNGDLGIVRRVDVAEGELVVDFEGREVAYDFGELDALVLAYATTIHKAQGSEYPAVVIPLTTQHYPMLRRKLVYTGVTRGRRLVVVVGQRRALAIAVRGGDEGRRWSRLKDRLAPGRVGSGLPRGRARTARRSGPGIGPRRPGRDRMGRVTGLPARPTPDTRERGVARGGLEAGGDLVVTPRGGGRAVGQLTGYASNGSTHK
jgi:exodeoxyribonuclease V alpha subunit